jgi:hypothetical protein
MKTDLKIVLRSVYLPHLDKSNMISHYLLVFM